MENFQMLLFLTSLMNIPTKALTISKLKILKQKLTKNSYFI